MTTVLCKQCLKSFYAKPSWIKNGYGIYCSRACKNTASKTGKIMICAICGTATYKQGKALLGSRSGKFFCGKSCQTKWRNVEFSQEKHPNWKNGNSAYRSLLARQSTQKICVRCKNEDFRVLAVHHIDKNHFNNTIDNLAWLCHNCHHLVHHDKHEYQRFMAAIV